jgi:hypothetical protein
LSEYHYLTDLTNEKLQRKKTEGNGDTLPYFYLRNNRIRRKDKCVRFEAIKCVRLKPEVIGSKLKVK